MHSLLNNSIQNITMQKRAFDNKTKWVANQENFKCAINQATERKYRNKQKSNELTRTYKACYLDSGASDHITNQRKRLQRIRLENSNSNNTEI